MPRNNGTKTHREMVLDQEFIDLCAKAGKKPTRTYARKLRKRGLLK